MHIKTYFLWEYGLGSFFPEEKSFRAANKM